MAQQSFTAQIDAWATKVEKRLEFVFKEAAQRVIEDMQRVGPSVANPDGGAGGHMPVDTGFLRASLVVSINSIDAGIKVAPKDVWTHTYDESGTTMIILGAKLGDSIFAVYTAAYARRMEYEGAGGTGYGFVRLAAQKWQSVVATVVREAQARVK
jgi:hypothetical protein